jgi:hypothetical protein
VERRRSRITRVARDAAEIGGIDGAPIRRVERPRRYGTAGDVDRLSGRTLSLQRSNRLARRGRAIRMGEIDTQEQHDQHRGRGKPDAAPPG